MLSVWYNICNTTYHVCKPRLSAAHHVAADASDQENREKGPERVAVGSFKAEAQENSSGFIHIFPFLG